MSTPEPQSQVRWMEVSSSYDGQRIDNFLRRILKGVPKSLIYRILRKGEVRVNRARIGPDYRLQVGDQIRIPPLRLAQKKPETQPSRRILERLEQAILWEDENLLVLDKPPGLPVHKGSGVDFGLIEILRAGRPRASFLELAHRLDRETSGCLVLAKNPATLQSIHAALRVGALAKRYLALLRGHWNAGIREVAAPLRKNVLRSGERRVEVDSVRGRPAYSRFTPISLFRQASLVEVTITTGRTHQIRVHAAHVNHPIAGDEKYGDMPFNRAMVHRGLRRLFLHAHSVTVPLGRRDIVIDAPLSQELKSVLEQLENTNE